MSPDHGLGFRNISLFYLNSHCESVGHVVTRRGCTLGHRLTEDPLANCRTEPLNWSSSGIRTGLPSEISYSLNWELFLHKGATQHEVLSPPYRRKYISFCVLYSMYCPPPPPPPSSLNFSFTSPFTLVFYLFHSNILPLHKEQLPR